MLFHLDEAIDWGFFFLAFIIRLLTEVFESKNS